MRGAYTATYLATVAAGFAKRRGVSALDVGAAFDLIVGTSVGGIVACALAAQVPLTRIVNLFRNSGARIFPRRLPTGVNIHLVADLFKRAGALKAGTDALRSALRGCFSKTTLAEVYARRKIALAIPAVELSQHRSWVFKTPHLPTSNHRDDRYALVDVCLATTAAPIYRSLADVAHADDGPDGYRVFADGGLWANNPVLVGLVEALNMTEPGRSIEVFSLGTCARPAGEQTPRSEVNRGLQEWRFGGLVASLSIDAQEFAFDNVARMLAPHLNRPIAIVRFPSERAPAALMPFLDLDETSTVAIDALINQARTDADIANSRCSRTDDRDGQLICKLFLDAPETVQTTGSEP
jgi:hypothetical protein